MVDGRKKGGKLAKWIFWSKRKSKLSRGFPWESSCKLVELRWFGGDLELAWLPEHGLDLSWGCQHGEGCRGVSGMFYAGLATRSFVVVIVLLCGCCLMKED